MAWVTLKEFVDAVVKLLLTTHIYEFHNAQQFMVHHHSLPTIDMDITKPMIISINKFKMHDLDV